MSLLSSRSTVVASLSGLALALVTACGDDTGAAVIVRDAAADAALDAATTTGSSDSAPPSVPDASPLDARIPDDDASSDDDAGPSLVPGVFAAYPALVTPPENPQTPDKALLGKILFWDEQLSSDDSTACGSCHRPSAGGSDPRALSARHPGADAELGTSDDPHGSFGIARCTTDSLGAITRKSDAVFGLQPQVTRRRAPTYLDAMFSPSLFVDGRAADELLDPSDGTTVLIAQGGALESQALEPLLNPVEMACEARDFAALVDKLTAATPLALAHDVPRAMQDAIDAAVTYPKLFEAAFGTPQISAARIAFAIASHERTLRSDQTPFDRWNAGDDRALNAQQRAGLALFTGKALCVTCHRPPMFHDLTFHNLGLVESSWDEGLAEHTHSEFDTGRFRTPTLRNVGLREPLGLLHDGAGPDARSLEALIMAYAQNRHLTSNTSIWLGGFVLTLDELAALTAFVREGLTDPRVARELPPFDHPGLAHP